MAAPQFQHVVDKSTTIGGADAGRGSSTGGEGSGVLRRDRGPLKTEQLGCDGAVDAVLERLRRLRAVGSGHLSSAG